MAAAHDITEAAFPFTRVGHRKLLAKANALRRANKHAWSMFFEQMEAVQELRENLEDIREPLDTAAANLPPQVAETLDETLKRNSNSSHSSLAALASARSATRQ